VSLVNERDSLLEASIRDRIACCWLQAEGLSGALAERCNSDQQRSYLMRRDAHRDDRLGDLENKALGLAQAIAELRVLVRIAG
jgi:hypothetical protein